MSALINPTRIKISEYPPNVLPAGSVVLNQTSEDGTCTVKGFYGPKSGETHIQEVIHNRKVNNDPN
jgi:hypothetical protein